MRAATLLATLALGALGFAGAALAQQSPLGPLPAPAQTTETPTVVVEPPTNSTSGGGLATWQYVLMFGAGTVLLLGIGWAIVSDARRRAPVAEGELAHPGMGAPKRNRSLKQQQRARAKAKAGRKQRRRSQRRR